MRTLKEQVLASKQYKSIIRLFNHCGIAVGKDFNLPRAKKQLQAEFRVARDGLIVIDDFTYTQHEVFEELENGDFNRRLPYHQKLWDNPEVLLLLEKNTVDLSTVLEAFILFWNDKEFDLFFSPYFATPFQYLSRTFLSQSRLKDMGELMGFEDFLQPAEREEAFRPIRIFLDETIRVLRNVNGENYNIMRPKLAHWIDEDWAMFFNRLPDEFYDIKVDIVTRLINIGVEIQKSNRRDCKKMSYQLVALTEMPENKRNIILNNHDAYTAPRGLRLKQGWWVVWIILILFRAIANDSCGSTSKRNIYPPEFKVIPDSTWKKVRDSMFKTQGDNIYK